MSGSLSLTALTEGILNGERRALAKAITMVESDLPEDRIAAQTLLTTLMPKTGGSHRIGISGMPGVGKSSLIEAFGLHCLAMGRKLAVLAVDPTSPITGGSILGDKTRMELLSREERSFIRPSPSGQSTGGVARHTREAILLCEAAGFDTIIVETVGVGQAEYSVASMVDSFVVMQLPGSGDELQGIKKGILELADIVVINKADGAFENLARQAKNEHERALMLVRAENQPPVILTSAISGSGIDLLFAAVSKHKADLSTTGLLKSKRAQQASQWFQQEILDQLKDWFDAQRKHQDFFISLEREVQSQRLPASAAAKLVLDKLNRQT